MESSRRPVPDAELKAVARLIRGQRWGSLATINEDGTPLAAMVAYAPMDSLEILLLHLSRLSRHTQNLLARPVASLAISEPDTGEGDPQTLARISLQGQVKALARDGSRFGAARETYLRRLPAAEQLFGFSDFVLFQLAPERMHYVGGFARAYAFGLAALRRAAKM